MIREIIEGWANVVWSSPLVKEKAFERAEICSECELRKGLRCGKCGCFITAKVRSRHSKCPVGKWGKY